LYTRTSLSVHSQIRVLSRSARSCKIVFSLPTGCVQEAATICTLIHAPMRSRNRGIGVITYPFWDQFLTLWDTTFILAQFLYVNNKIYTRCILKENRELWFLLCFFHICKKLRFSKWSNCNSLLNTWKQISSLDMF
jgi:hypothetical protein